MKVEKKYQLPGGSILNQNMAMFDFVESYFLTIESSDIEINKLISSFFKSIPKWLLWILNYRINFETVDGPKISYSEGDKIGPFHLFRLNNKEAILGINTRYMDYRLSLLIERNNNFRLCFSTTLTLNNFLGKCYFAIVKTIYRLATLHILQTIHRYLHS